jgi:thiamine-monophosphate kinase
LIADAGHLATASGCGVCLDLEQMPLSGPAQAWLGAQPDRLTALTGLASGGDDYQIVLAAPAGKRQRLEAAGCTRIGEFVEGPSEIRLAGVAYAPGPGGWRHE